MANGSGGPLPDITAAVWDTIKDATWDSGGWNISGTVKFLFLKRTDHMGATEWALYSTAEAPSYLLRAGMDQTSWNNISGGTLNTETNTISNARKSWHIEFYNNGGAASRTWEE